MLREELLHDQLEYLIGFVAESGESDSSGFSWAVSADAKSDKFLASDISACISRFLLRNAARAPSSVPKQKIANKTVVKK